ncbi:MAG: IS110 family transposase [Gammaproteobacteria bacterium]|nr:IS110 family transposase [Gammaproteobacteria bacterium]
MNFLGIDVSKNKLDAVLLCAGAPDKELHRKVPNTPEGFKTLMKWACKKAGCELCELHVVLEATGPYHEAGALAFFEAGARVSVVNPAQIKYFAKGEGVKAKNDKQDAAVIARFGLKNNPRLWHPEPAEYRRLRELLNRLEAVDRDIRREKNRLEKAEVSHASQDVIDSINRSVTFLEAEKSMLKQEIEKLVKKHPSLKEDKKLLESIPGVGPTVSAWMTVLLQHGERFDSASQAAAYTGVIPTEHESGDSVRKKPHMSKTGPSALRAKLYMAAMVATRHNPDVKALYDRLIAKGKSKMSALGAAMRKLVHICFGVIKNRTAYQSQVSQ